MSTNKRTAFLMLLVCLAGLIQVRSVFGQEARGTIVGVVKDASGGVVPGSEVKVTNKAMGTVTSIVTNDTGIYQAAYLIPGKYKIEAVMPGFKTFVADDVELRVNERLEFNIRLEVGEQSETVLVTGETPLLNTTSASMGQVVDARRVADLPVPHGNPYFLIGLASGVSFTRDPRLDRPFEPTHIVGYSMDGTRANRSDVTIDGVVATATANPGEVISSYVPPADIVSEIAVQTATFDASFGQTEGGVTNLSMKSGTNQLHGTAYWTKMAPGIFANDFWANRTNQERGDFDYNRWGGSAGGPVWIPKLYDGRNRTFFMWGYEGIHESRPRNNGTPTVPTAAMKNGDFSQLLDLDSKYQIYNPFTRRPAATPGRYEQDPFEGNIIPASLINPVAKKILSYFPDPLQAGDPDGQNNYVQPNLLEVAKYYTHSVRVDHVFSDKHKVFGRGSVYRRDSTYNNYFHNEVTGNEFQFFSRAFTFDDVYTFNPTTVLNLRYGYNRFIRGDAGNSSLIGMDLTTLGFPKEYSDLISPDIRRFPRIDISGYQGTTTAGYFRPNDSHSFIATVNKIFGSHAFKTGMEFRAYRETNRTFDAAETGRFNFDASWTRGPLDNSPTAPGNLGQSVASLLLGLPSHSNSYVTRAASYAEQSTSWGFYFHDDWKVNDRLTLNLGLRYEYEGALTERFDRTVRGFDFDVVQPFEGQARAIYAKNPTPEVPPEQFFVRGGLTFAGVNGEPHGLWNAPKKQFMPRVGLALKLDPKTVVRAGYGIFFGFLGQRRGDVIQTGFSRNTPFIATVDNGVSFIADLSNPFPDGILDPIGASQGTLTSLGNSVTFFNPNPKTPYMQRWQLGFQRELGAGYVVEAGYIGNRGTHLEYQSSGNVALRNLNATPNKYLSTSPVRDDATNDYLTQSKGIPNPFYDPATKKTILPAGASGSFTGREIARYRLLRPFLAFDNVNMDEQEGWSWYHSFQLNVQKRFSKGYTLMGNYTYSEFMQATELLNAGDPRPTEVISDLDRPHRLTISGVYEFPFGYGKPFLADNPVVSRIVGGWQLSGIYTFQSGSPIQFGNVIFKGNSIDEVLIPYSERTIEGWFKTDASFWETDAKKQLTNNVRTFPLRFDSLRADRINNYDFSVVKKTPITEGKEFHFKAEFLNAFNHPQFGAPDTNPASDNFGKIRASTQVNYARRIQLSLKFVF
ncbi:MAG: TonB-dependent receptor domain-containing protein [Acidobacteriota bacterium]